MKYVSAIFILWSTVYILSYAKHNLKKKNKSAAAGAILLAIVIVILPLVVMFMQ